MRDLLTPRQVARSIDVSESSVKRWCDKGVIPTRYTAGGHRRIVLADFIQFVRESKYDLIHPEALGLPPTSGTSSRVLDRACEQLTEALLDGEELRSRQIIFDMWMAEHSVAAICDDVIAAAFTAIGDKWACGDADVYQERRGCEITVKLLNELRALLPHIQSDAPLAIGGAAVGDQYSLGTTMVELVLRDGGWKAASLGNNLPFESMAVAIRANRPRLFWMSCSHIVDEEQFLSGYHSLYDEFSLDVAFVVGGYALTEEIRQRMRYAAYCDNMQHLQGFAQSLMQISSNDS